MEMLWFEKLNPVVGSLAHKLSRAKEVSKLCLRLLKEPKPNGTEGLFDIFYIKFLKCVFLQITTFQSKESKSTVLNAS